MAKEGKAGYEATVSLAGLKARGWTPALIVRFLGGPDLMVPNPHYRSGPKMRLYRLARVETAEQSSGYREVSAKKAAARQTASIRGKAANLARKNELLAWVDALPIVLVSLNEAEVAKEAVLHYNNLWMSRENYEKTASINDDPAFLVRISVNYLRRHECSRYEAMLEQVYGKVGVAEARRRIKGRVLSAICEAFPSLAGEFARQGTEMREEVFS